MFSVYSRVKFLHKKSLQQFYTYFMFLSHFMYVTFYTLYKDVKAVDDSSHKH